MDQTQNAIPADKTEPWALPNLSHRPTHRGDPIPQAEWDEWRALVQEVAETALANAWSKAEVARRVNIPASTLGQWFAGTYTGRYDVRNEALRTWLDSFDDVTEMQDMIPVSPPFIETAFSREVQHMLLVAQSLPTMVMISADAGIGKTFTARAYARRYDNAFIATISPHTRTVTGMMIEIADALDINQPNPGRLLHSIGARLKRVGAGSLLIVDEAQNLSDDAINQLRHFVDIHHCGVAVIGNNETYHRFAKSWSDDEHRYGQLRRRIFKRMKRDKARREDLEKFIAAWGITDPKQVKFLVEIGYKPGAMGQIDMTIKLARMTATGGQREMTLDDLRKAWANRDVEPPVRVTSEAKPKLVSTRGTL